MMRLLLSMAEYAGKLNVSDYRKIAKLHASCIDLGFLSSLGYRFLALVYEAIDADENSILILEKKKNEVIGFVAGGRGMNSVYRKMMIRFPRVLLALFPSMLNPLKLKRIIELIYFSKKRKPHHSCPEAELFSIAVIDSARGGNVAKKLYGALGQRFLEEGESAFCMVVGESLSRAHRFYQKMGASAFAEVSVHDGQTSTLYRQDLPIP